MLRRLPLAALLFVPLIACGGKGDWLKDQLRTYGEQQTSVDPKTAAEGLKQALEQGTQHAVAVLGRENGYFGNPRVKITLPENFERVEKTLRRVGQGQIADDFILSLNRAAEAAAPEAKAVFVDVIRNMTVKDALAIVRGPDDAATTYFREHAESTLKKKFKPFVATATDRVGATHTYKRFVTSTALLAPYRQAYHLDVDDYVTQKAVDGLFLMIADEEKRIRADPIARTTELLKKVFSRASTGR
jgi:hypothetical protein